ncbi:MAG: hypothetical protein LUH58_10190 [Lachnospiraceae bacterium]|nr:hypothetical protein [Lachnospiraceae bacterium]
MGVKDTMTAKYMQRNEIFADAFNYYIYGGRQVIEAVNSDAGFQHLGRTEVDVLNACVNASLTMGESEVELNVCQAIQTLNERAAEKAANQRQIEVLLQSVKNLMETMGWSAAQAMDNMKVSENDRKALEPYL